MRALPAFILSFIAAEALLFGGAPSDVKLHAGYLVLTESDETRIFDATVSPMAQVAQLNYAGSSVPITLEAQDLRLYVYHYANDTDNGIYIYDMGNPSDPVMIKDLRMEGLIQGGFVAHGQTYKAKGGRFLVDGNKVFFFRSDLDPYFTEYLYSFYFYDFKSGLIEWSPSQIRNYTNESPECDFYMPYHFWGGDDIFLSSNETHIWIVEALSKFWFARRADLSDDGAACFTDIARQSPFCGGAGGPMRFIDQWAVLRGFGLLPGFDTEYSGIHVLAPYQYEGATWFFSDFACPWTIKHGGKSSGITYDNSRFDVQDLIVKNGDIYLTSYFTKSVPYTYFYQDWNGYMECQPEKWDFYDLDAHPYGMAAANGVLYVAAEDGLHEFPLIHPDEKLPEARITEMRQEGNLLTVRGKARDDEGIRTVWVRLGHAHVSKAGTPTAECRHCPPVSLWDEWEWRLETTGIAPGEYDIKVIIEDKDGDFTALSGGTVRIGDSAKVSKGNASGKEGPALIPSR